MTVKKARPLPPELIHFRAVLIRETDLKFYRWRYRWHKNVRMDGEEVGGKCEAEQRVIRINTGVSPRRQLEVLIHEGLHQSFYDLSEEAVERAEDNLITILTAAGFIPAAKKKKRAVRRRESNA